MDTYFGHLESRQYLNGELQRHQLTCAMTDMVWESCVFPQPSEVIRGTVLLGWHHLVASPTKLAIYL